jgi:hypothetical protein
MALAIHEILMVEATPNVVPARIAGVIIDYLIGRIKLIGRMSKSGDQLSLSGTQTRTY